MLHQPLQPVRQRPLPTWPDWQAESWARIAYMVAVVTGVAVANCLLAWPGERAYWRGYAASSTLGVVSYGVLALHLSQLAFACFWLALSPWRRWWSLPVIAATVLLTARLLGGRQESNVALAFLGGMTAICWPVRTFQGWRFDYAPELPMGLPNMRVTATLAGLFELTSVWAIAIGLGRLLLEPIAVKAWAGMLLVIAMAHGYLAVCGAWGLYAIAPRMRGTGVLPGLHILGAGAIFVLTGDPGIVVLTLASMFFAATVWLFQRLGWRLLRVPRPGASALLAAPAST